MIGSRQLVARWLVDRLPARTIRLRLTVVYGSLFLVAGAALVSTTYILVRREYTGNFFLTAGRSSVIGVAGNGQSFRATQEAAGPGGLTFAPNPREIIAAAQAQSAAALHQLLVNSGIAFALMAVLSIMAAWVVAGRALLPLRTITNAARDISASNLHRRLSLEGPDDELKQLATTFDGLLERLEASFDAQRQFVANASHELRTPLTLERTLLEVALGDPDASVESLRAVCEQVLTVEDQQEHLIEALLTLSRSQSGLDRREPVDLAAVSARCVQAIGHDGLELAISLQPAVTNGDERLVERLTANLIANAVRHNVPGGEISVTTEMRDGQAVFRIENSGPSIPPAELDRLFQPFQRLEATRASGADGSGLGLSIVHAVATAHDAEISARSRTAGGLLIEICFPTSVPVAGVMT